MFRKSLEDQILFYSKLRHSQCWKEKKHSFWNKSSFLCSPCAPLSPLASLSPTRHNSRCVVNWKSSSPAFFAQQIRFLCRATQVAALACYQLCGVLGYNRVRLAGLLTCGKVILRSADSCVFFSTFSSRGRTTSCVSIPVCDKKNKVIVA